MKLPKRATEVEVYINEIVYQDHTNTTKTYKPPKWLERGLQDFWNRAHLQGQISIKDAIKEILK